VWLWLWRWKKEITAKVKKHSNFLENQNHPRVVFLSLKTVDEPSNYTALMNSLDLSGVIVIILR
jgi:hypothetical protein